MRVSRLSILVVSLALACGPAEAPVDASSSIAGGNKLVKVMTLNLYLGADLAPAMAPGLTPDEFIGATTAIWAQVQANDFHVRAEGIANEIAAARPDVVGLQEVYTWRLQEDGDVVIGNPVPATEPVYDYLDILQAALAARGLEYAVAASVELTDVEVPVLKLPPPAEGNPLSDVRMTDHEVILVRADAELANAAGGAYAADLTVETPAAPVVVKRGWVSVDVKHQGEWFRLVSTHPDAYVPLLRTAQVQELVGMLSEWTGRLVVIGDMNSRPDGSDADGGAAYQLLLAAGLHDAWAVLYPDQLGYTSGWGTDLSWTEDPVTGEPLALYERIDLVLYRGAIVPRSATVVGDELADRVGGLWPSDHAGVVGTLRLVDQRFLPAP